MMLTAHLLGAILSIGALAGAGAYIWRERPSRWLAITVPVLMLGQLMTGIGLLFEGAGVVRMCVTGGAYLLILGAVEYKLLVGLGWKPRQGYLRRDDFS